MSPGARDARGTWAGFVAPRSHGYRPTHWDETHAVALGLVVVSVSQPVHSQIRATQLKMAMLSTVEVITKSLNDASALIRPEASSP